MKFIFQKSVKKVVEYWMFMEMQLYIFMEWKPPAIESQYDGNEFTALPIYNSVYVPKKAKKTYIKWAKTETVWNGMICIRFNRLQRVF